MLEDADAPVLVTQESSRRAAARAQAHASSASIATGRQIADAPPADRPRARATRETLAYVIYTSGSTGAPEGRRDHATARSSTCSQAHARAPGLERGRRRSSTSPRSAFDISVLELYLPLVCGGAARGHAARRRRRRPSARGSARARSAPRSCRRRPTTWAMLVDAGWQGARGLTIVCGGEALPRALATTLLRPRRSRCGTCTARPRRRSGRRSAALEPGEGPPPIGRPIANTPVLRRSTRHSQPVPIGVAGRAADRRRRRRARLPRPAGADRRALRPRSVLDRAGRAPLPHRRPRALAAGRDARVPRPARPPGQGARLPHRARRDRGRARRHPDVRHGRRVVREDAAGRAAPGRLRRARTGVGRSSAEALRRHLACVAAGLHGAVRVRGARRASR